MSRKERKTTIINTIKLQKRLQIKTRSHQTRANRNVKCLRRTSTVKFDFYSRVTFNESWEVSEWVWLRLGVLGGLVVMTLAQIAGDQGLIPHWGTQFFSDHITYSTHCYIWWPMWPSSLTCMRTCFLLGGVNVTVIRCPWWSSSCDARLDSGRLGFNPPLRYTSFSDHITYSTHCYINVTLY